MKNIAISVLTAGAIFFSGAFCPTSAEETETDSKAMMLFESKCKLCHTIERPKSKRKTKEGWEATVMRMKNRNGAPVTDEDARMIIDFLAREHGPLE